SGPKPCSNWGVPTVGRRADCSPICDSRDATWASMSMTVASLMQDSASRRGGRISSSCVRTSEPPTTTRTVLSASYAFPFPDSSFDVVYAASLFTHLLPDETANYFHQCRRVLRPAGRCLFSCFLLDFYRGRGKSISPLYEFEHPLEGSS